MVIDLYITGSEKNALYKVLQNEIEAEGTLRESTSILNPSFNIQAHNLSQYNYCFIPDFDRYYFINDIESVRNNLWRISCTVDVLMSYQYEIGNLQCILSDNSSPDYESYMHGDVWASTVKTKTDVINFPNGLLETGEYILITSGGVAGA